MSKRIIKPKKNRFVSYFQNTKEKLRAFFTGKVRPVKTFAKRRPLTFFLLLLLVLLVIIVVGDRLRKPSVSDTPQEIEAKQVEVYRIGSVPHVTVSGKIEKSGVITVVAQSGGIVQKINMKEGDTVKKGQTVVSLSSNYQGAVLPSVQRQISQTSYQYQKDNYAIEKEIIAKDRDAALKTDENTDRLRQITSDSRVRTREILDISKPLLDSLSSIITHYESISTPSLADAATDEQAILGLKQQQAGLVGSIASAEQGLKASDYAEDGNNPPARLSDLEREKLLRQLDLQEKTLDLNLEIARLNVQVSSIAESLMYPASPFAGRVERIHIKVGESVSPGDPIATIAGDVNSITVVALVSKDVAASISPFEPSIVTVGSQTYELTPTHISTEPTDGRLFAVTYTLPQLGPASATTIDIEKGIEIATISGTKKETTEGQFISISLPVGYADTNSIVPFIPLESVFQSHDTSLVFVNEDGVARSREVELGYVTGRFVEVTKGLWQSDVILLDRTLIEGDPVTVKSL